MVNTRKRFGQHFLHDKQVIQHIIDAVAPKPNDHFVEIGPGQGALTVPLLKIVHQLDAIEIDRDLIPALTLRCASKGQLNIYQADVLAFDFSKIATETSLLRLIGNLPYNISTPLLFHILTFSKFIDDMHFMLQREVAERIASNPGDEAYGRLSIMLQYHCKVVLLFNVLAHSFYPPPQVESSVVRLVPHRDLPYHANNYGHFSNLVREAFSHRRKTLRNGLKQMITDADWKKMPWVDSHCRPEEISVSDFVKISNYLVGG